MNHVPKVAIIYLSYHSESYLPDVVTALKRLDYPHDRVTFVAVDNPHPEFGSSVRALEEALVPLSKTVIPEVVILPQQKNLGYAGGNNVGIAWAKEHGFEYVLLHNDDGFFAGDTIRLMVEGMEKHKTIAVSQPLILLYPDTGLINSAGNSFHYLGFGFCHEYRTPLSTYTNREIADVSYVSGAAMMIRMSVVKEVGMLDEDFFMYHEDLEYSLRCRMVGYRSAIIPTAHFYHKYQFGRSIQKFYWMERNRFAVLLMYYRFLTILVLLPMLIAMEIGLWMFAFKNGWAKERWQVYRYWLTPKHWESWIHKRHGIQFGRKIKDHELLARTVPTILFQEQAVKHPLLEYLGNPVMKLYYDVIVKGLIRW